MFKKLLFLLLILQVTACAELQQAAGTLLSEGTLTNAEIGNGLKEALRVGISKGSDQLSVKDGYFKNEAYKILLPEEVQQVTSKLKNIPGFDQIENEMLRLLNRAAEDAAKEAKPIFVDAIKQITFDDAMGILMGDKDAATQYLTRSTRESLYTAFIPKIKTSLDRVNATEYWEKAMNTYNKIPFVQQVNPQLDDYVTDKALDGLFGMVQKEELNIRSNVSARTSDLLKKVFAKQDR